MNLRDIEFGVDCINLAQGRDQWKALVNAVINLCVSLYVWYGLD
jgi:hypothetical protein